MKILNIKTVTENANCPGGRGFSGFQVTGASSKTQKKSLDQNLTPQKSHTRD